MRLETITCCVGYSDFLAETVRHNRGLLDRWLIVTTAQDTETRELCWKQNLECLVTEDFYRAGHAFDKARAVDRGLQLLTHGDWLLHLDADIVLPPHFRTSLDAADLDPASIYGCDRVLVKGWPRWQRLEASGFLSQFSRSNHFNVCFPGGFEVGARWADLHHGWVPIGFFQLWHRTASVTNGMRYRRYPNHGHNDAARTDVQFALQWDRHERRLLPEIVVLHLESDGAAVGANWCGRTTPRFGPPPGASYCARAVS